MFETELHEGSDPWFKDPGDKQKIDVILTSGLGSCDF